MISYSVYKLMHLTGVLMVFLALGGLATHLANGGVKTHSFRKMIGVTHGVGLLLSLVGGMGALARLGVPHGSLPGWAIAKIVIWIVFAALPALLYRKQQFTRSIWILMIMLGLLAAHFAGSKSF